MEEDLDAQLAANQAYEHYRATGRDTKGRHLGRRPNPCVAPMVPDAIVSVTDPDSRHIKANEAYVQGYNTQAVVDENQIVLAAEITNSTVDFSQLAPMITAALGELEHAGVAGRPRIAVADAQYWNEQHMDEVIADQHIQVLIPPDSGARTTPRPGWAGGRYAAMRSALASPTGKAIYRRRKQMIEPVFAHTKHNRQVTRFLRMRPRRGARRVAVIDDDPQSDQAPPPPPRRCRGLNGPHRGSQHPGRRRATPETHPPVQPGRKITRQPPTNPIVSSRLGGRLRGRHRHRRRADHPDDRSREMRSWPRARPRRSQAWHSAGRRRAPQASGMSPSDSSARRRPADECDRGHPSGRALQIGDSASERRAAGRTSPRGYSWISKRRSKRASARRRSRSAPASPSRRWHNSGKKSAD